MSVAIDLETARRILGDAVVGPTEVGDVLGLEGPVPAIPYSAAELEAAAGAGEMLLLRVERAAGQPLTLLRLIERFPRAFDQKFLTQMGYQLKEEWGIEREPLANRDTCRPGWMLVRQRVLDEARNLPYEDQGETLIQYARRLGLPPGAVCRRQAVEIVYDLVLYHEARAERLLAESWDWSASRTLDGGYLNVGGFGTNGMQILCYSTAVRHGALGVCPSRLAQSAVG